MNKIYIKLIYLFRIITSQQLGLAIFIQTLTIFSALFLKTQVFHYAFYNDEPSYTMFQFSSLKSILDNHRSLGLPVFIKINNLFFSNFKYWPYLQYSIYLISIFFLFWALIKCGFDKIFSFIIVSVILWNLEIYKMLPFVQTEIMSVSFLHLSIASIFLATKYNNLKTNLLASFCIFFLYQIRTNLAYVVFLVPFWAAASAWLINQADFTHIKHIFWRFSLISILPFLFFSLLRFLTVGQWGLSTMSGGCLAGHAVQYLNEENITRLSGKIRIIAQEILHRKRQLDFPCNLSPFSQNMVGIQTTTDAEANCFGVNLMTAWLVVIEQQHGVEPFTTQKKNIKAWDYTQTLSPFYFTYYNSVSDKQLMQFSSEILKLEWRRYLSWLVNGSFLGIKIILSDLYRNLVYICYFLLSVITHFYIIKRKWYKQYVKWYRQIILITFIALTYATIGYFLIIVFNFPFSRMFVPLFQYVAPSLILWSILPIWLNKKLSK